MTKTTLGGFVVFFGDEILPSFIRVIINEYKDPYSPPRISWFMPLSYDCRKSCMASLCALDGVSDVLVQSQAENLGLVGSGRGRV